MKKYFAKIERFNNTYPVTWGLFESLFLLIILIFFGFFPAIAATLIFIHSRLSELIRKK